MSPPGRRPRASRRVPPEATPSAVAGSRSPLVWLALANVVVVGLIAVLLVITLGNSRAAHRQRAFDAVESLARGLERNIQAELDLVDIALHAAALAARGAAPALASTAADLQQLIPAAEGLRVVDRVGSPFETVDAQRLWIGGPRPSGDGGRWVLDLARPVVDVDGTRDRLVVAELDTRRFERMFADLDLGGRSAISLRMADLALVARHTDPPTSREGLGTRRVSTQLLEMLAQAPDAGTYLAETALDGIERANAYRRVGGHPLIVLVGLATTDYLATWRNDARLAAGLALLAAGVMGGASWLALRAWRRGESSRRALTRERQRLRALLLTASDGLHVLDRDGRLLEFSDAFAEMLGRSREALAGAHASTWEAGLDPADLAQMLRGFRVGERYLYATRFRRRDGSQVDVDVAAVGVQVDEDEYFYLAARDVTDKKRSLAALQASETFLDRTGRIASVGGWEFDVAARRLRLTAQAHRLLGLPAHAAPGLRQCLRLFAAPDRRALARALARAAHAGQASDLSLPARTRDGRPLWLRCFSEPVVEHGRTVRWVGAVQDITELRTRTAELQREQALRSQVERVLRERGEMLDVLAHEVRQPLNNASAALQSAAATLRDVGEQVVSPRLGRAQTVLGQVMARLDNTLAVAAQLARPGPVEREDTDIDTLLAVAIADMPLAERARVQVRRETAARTASLDMSLMRLALRNLLSNALKFSPAGAPVTVTLADSEQPLGLVIDVADQGPGVPERLRATLFERGARDEAAGSVGLASQGLGLYIVRRVMELHGGVAELLRTGADGTTMRLIVAEEPDEPDEPGERAAAGRSA
jgi:PAS domain S-box-containing protein